LFLVECGAEAEVYVFVPVAEPGVEPAEFTEQVGADREASSGDSRDGTGRLIPGAVVGGEDPVGRLEKHAGMLDLAVRVDEPATNDPIFGRDG
jgi:hypothetical protein